MQAQQRQKILVVDDDLRLRDLLKRYLSEQGFAVDTVPDAGAMDRQMGRVRYDLLVLDLMLPGEDGFAICRRLRAADPAVGIVMLTARGDDVDRIAGLETGADDYIAKPFNPRELVARIRAILRRTRAGAAGAGPPAQLTIDDVTLDLGRRVARRAGTALALTTVEFSLLEMLVRAAGSVVRRDDLARGALGRSLLPFDRSIDVHVSRVRKKLGPRPDGGERIATLRAVGYLYTRQDPAARR